MHPHSPTHTPTMKPTHIFSFLLLLLLPSVKSQQGYEGNAQLNCDVSSNSTTVLGYTCNSLPSCSSFISFRSQLPFQSPSLLSSNQFAVNDLIIRPISCSCFKNLYYQHDVTYRIKTTGETYFTVANDTYQGLSTCQALIAQNPYDPEKLPVGDEITVPIRCACPTPEQRSNGVKFLLTYLITWGDDVPTISKRFGVDTGSVLHANSLAPHDWIYPFTTLLIPLNKAPSKDQVQAPPAAAAAAAAAAVLENLIPIF